MDSKTWIFFGGPYGNHQALLKLQQICKKSKIPSSHIVCTGDYAAYCSNPNEVIDLIRRWKIHCIAGNVDVNISSDCSDCGCGFKKGSTCDSLSEEWYAYNRKVISEKNKRWLSKLPMTHTINVPGKRMAMIHASCNSLSEFIFESTPWNIKKQSFDSLKADIVITGHSGIPFMQQKNGKVWINTGALGMPANDGTPRAWFSSLTIRKNELVFKTEPLQYPYDVEFASMDRARISQPYSKALRTGLWPSMDILPKQERMRAGIELKSHIEIVKL